MHNTHSLTRVVLSVNVDSGGTGQARAYVNGTIVNVYRTYSGQSGTCDGVLFEQFPGNLERTILTVSNSATNGNSPVLAQAVDSSNSAIAGTYLHPFVCGELVLQVTGGTAATAGVVWYVTVLE